MSEPSFPLAFSSSISISLNALSGRSVLVSFLFLFFESKGKILLDITRQALRHRLTWRTLMMDFSLRNRAQCLDWHPSILKKEEKRRKKNDLVTPRRASGRDFP